MIQILIVEDEPRIAAFTAKGLKAAGYPTRVESSGVAAVSLALSGEFDLIILDIGLPDIDGFEVLKRIRSHRMSLPVIILTARSTVPDIVAGLEGGADDYMAKPFSFQELLARVRLRLRSDAPSESATVLRHRDISLDLHTHHVTVAGRHVELSAREFTLMEAFMRQAGEALSREQLLSAAWGYDFDPGSNVVDVYVRYLRHKLGAERLETVRNIGYRLV
ncbi:MAG: response regulator transcription factor [Propionicimonas sp.]